MDIPMYINGKAVRTGKTMSIHPPHETKHVLGQFHIGTKIHVEKAIESALKVRENWSNMTWETRAHISAQSPSGWCIAPLRSYRSRHRLCETRRIQTRRCDCRNHE